MARFVILRHESPRGLHWDLMIQTGPALSTWALTEEPVSGRAIDAEALADHRLAYLDYEGPIAGGRGTVARWDRGDCDIECQDETHVVVELRGTKLSGRATLARCPEPCARWTFRFESRPLD
ncbi:MAG: hypothetical protein NUV77_09170 [Thermoguttaceae bacterium]|jgi:hypothetical protein|nr:hypothetical protein [Thermoguttaceae bacterium]